MLCWTNTWRREESELLPESAIFLRESLYTGYVAVSETLYDKLTKSLVYQAMTRISLDVRPLHGVHLISVDNFFIFFEIFIFCFVDAICDLVHAMEATCGLSYLLTASGNLF